MRSLGAMAEYTIRGLKMSARLVMVSLGGLSPDAACELVGRIAAQRVNLVLADLWPEGKDTCLLRVCVEAPQAMAAYSMFTQAAQTHGLGGPEIIDHLSGITVYPRGKGLGLPLALEACLCQAGIDCLGLSSSLSSCVALVPEAQTRTAISHLAAKFNLPEHASPCEAKVRVVQAEKE